MDINKEIEQYRFENIPNRLKDKPVTGEAKYYLLHSELIELIERICREQRAKNHKHFKDRWGGHCDAGNIILKTSLLTDNK